MKIAQIKLYRFRIPFKFSLNFRSVELKYREGLIVKLTDVNNSTAFGEISPLPGFSEETIEECIAQCLVEFENLRQLSIVEQFRYPFTYLEENLSRLYPSVQFGIETALLSLAAKCDGTTLAKYLNDTSANTVLINGLLTGDTSSVLEKAKRLKDENYNTVKLKVGSRGLSDDIELTRQVRQIIGNDMALRLDSNRSWNLEDAKNFCDSVAELDIEYLEEPISDVGHLVSALNNGEFAVPIALDETLREILPAELHTFDAAEAVIIKPTLIGLFKSLRFAHQAQSQGITPVISSSFESGLGILILAQISSAIVSDNTPMGLDTYNVFSNDILKVPLPVKEGMINVDELLDTDEALELNNLKEVAIS